MSATREQIEDVWQRLAIGRIIGHDMSNECRLAARIVELEQKQLASLEALVTILWFQRHLMCQDAEIKTIGSFAFDPRRHCSKCRSADKAGKQPTDSPFNAYFGAGINPSTGEPYKIPPFLRREGEAQ